jgi:hypothetical protein
MEIGPEWVGSNVNIDNFEVCESVCGMPVHRRAVSGAPASRLAFRTENWITYR